MIWPPFVLDALMADEGFRSQPYLDAVEKLSIGFGRNLIANPLTIDEAKFLLLNDINRTVAALNKALPWWTGLDAVRQGVLLNMAYNLGVMGLLTFKRTLEAVKQGRYDEAATEMLQSKWAAQVGHRAKRLAQEMKTGVRA